MLANMCLAIRLNPRQHLHLTQRFPSYDFTVQLLPFVYVFCKFQIQMYGYI